MPRDDPRVRATADRIERELCRRRIRLPLQGHRRRARRRRGRLPHLLVLARRQPRLHGPVRACSRAVRAPDRARQRRRPMAEQFDPAAGEQLGNFPQAFSHMGLINSAIQLPTDANAGGRRRRGGVRARMRIGYLLDANHRARRCAAGPGGGGGLDGVADRGGGPRRGGRLPLGRRPRSPSRARVPLSRSRAAPHAARARDEPGGAGQLHVRRNAGASR